MPYTPISNEGEIRAAFHALKNLFSEGADEETILGGRPASLHEESGIVGSFDDVPDLGRYLILFGVNERRDRTVFEANPPKAGTDGGRGEGLFVKDEHGKRYLVRTGNFALDGENPYLGMRGKFRENSEPDRWIEVENKSDRH